MPPLHTVAWAKVEHKLVPPGCELNVTVKKYATSGCVQNTFAEQMTRREHGVKKLVGVNRVANDKREEGAIK